MVAEVWMCAVGRMDSEGFDNEMSDEWHKTRVMAKLGKSLDRSKHRRVDVHRVWSLAVPSTEYTSSVYYMYTSSV